VWFNTRQNVENPRRKKKKGSSLLEGDKQNSPVFHIVKRKRGFRREARQVGWESHIVQERKVPMKKTLPQDDGIQITFILE